MKLTKTIWLQRLTAVILIGVWTLLHAVKVFHHHQLPDSFSVSKASLQEQTVIDQSNGATASDCSVCDFHLAKNVEHTVAEYTLQPSSYYIKPCSACHSSFLSSYTSTVTGRGPPPVI